MAATTNMQGAVEDHSAATSNAVVMEVLREEEIAASNIIRDDDADTANAVVLNANVSTNNGGGATRELLQEHTNGDNTHLVTAPVEWSSARLTTSNRQEAHPTDGEGEEEGDTQASSMSSFNQGSSVQKNGICSSRCKVVAVTATFLVLVIAIAMSLVFGLEGTANTNTTTTNPNDFVTRQQAMARVRTYLLQETNWSDPLSLMDPTSAQTKAMHQLALEGGEIPISQQRYGLLVVWYGLGGKDEGTTLEQQQHECDWSLVACNDENQVTSVLFSKQGLDGIILEEVALLSHLEHLHLKENKVHGQLPAALYRLSNLVSLSLGFNEFRSELSDDIGSLTKLENLGLNDNDFSGPLPDSIKSLTNLKSIEIWRTDLAGPIVVYAAGWPNLEVLTIAENFNINGTIPSEIGILTNLRELILQRTHVSGTIPSEVGLLSNLDSFSVGHYVLLDDSVTVSGTLPTEIGNCQKLRKIVVESSNMTGPLPSSIGNLSSTLKTLSITDCSFTGSIPDSFQSLTDIHEIHLDNNAFTGTLPEWLGSFERMRHLRVFWNQFTGTVPSGLCRASLKFFYDCELECDCCGKCGPLI